MRTKESEDKCDSGGIASGRYVIMSLLGGRTQKIHAISAEKRREKKKEVPAREAKREERKDVFFLSAPFFLFLSLASSLQII